MSKISLEVGQVVELIKVSFTSSTIAGGMDIRLEGPFRMKVCQQNMSFLDEGMKGKVPVDSVKNMARVKNGVMEGSYALYVPMDKVEEAKELAVKHICEDSDKEIANMEASIEKLKARKAVFEEGKYNLRDRIGEDFI